MNDFDFDYQLAQNHIINSLRVKGFWVSDAGEVIPAEAMDCDFDMELSDSSKEEE